MPTNRLCPECRQPHSRPGKSEFCGNACKAAFHNRRTKRGALLYDVEMLMRVQPDLAAEWVARRDAMLTKWQLEDKAAGRKRTTRKQTDVSYDADFPRTYEIENFVLQPE